MKKGVALLLVLVFLTASCVMAVRRVSASTAALSLPPSPTYSQESMSTPETKQSLSIPPIWLIAIAVLVVIVIIEAIIYFFLKAKKTKP